MTTPILRAPRKLPKFPKLPIDSAIHWRQAPNNGRSLPWLGLQTWQHVQIRTQYPHFKEEEFYERYWMSANHCMMCGELLDHSTCVVVQPIYIENITEEMCAMALRGSRMMRERGEI